MVVHPARWKRTIKVVKSRGRQSSDHLAPISAKGVGREFQKPALAKRPYTVGPGIEIRSTLESILGERRFEWKGGVLVCGLTVPFLLEGDMHSP